MTVEFDVEDDRDPNGGEKDSNLRVWKGDQAAEGDDHISFPDPLLKVKSPSFGEKGCQAVTKPKPFHLPILLAPPLPLTTPLLLDELRQDRCHVREGGNLLGGEKKTSTHLFASHYCFIVL